MCNSKISCYMVHAVTYIEADDDDDVDNDDNPDDNDVIDTA